MKNIEMINAKKRFDILKRDNFRCQYCWKSWKDVSLEVDHIIPKSKWWTDNIENLITCCRECNSWKWNRSLNVQELRKDKMIETSDKIRKDFLFKWNCSMLWTIQKWTYILLSKYIELRLWNMIYKRFFENPSQEKIKKEFEKWWKMCDRELDDCSCFIDDELENCLSDIIDDDCRTWWNIVDEWVSDIRLNLIIAKRLVQMENKWMNAKQSWNYYFVLKMTYRKDFVEWRFNS